MYEKRSLNSNLCQYGYSRGDILLVGSTRDQALPCFMSLKDNIGGIFLKEANERLCCIKRDNKQQTLFLASPLKAKTFSGLPSGILQMRNHSLVARIRPGSCFSTSSMSISNHIHKPCMVLHIYYSFPHIPLSLEARGSLTSIAMTFQSVSPSSKRAMTPRILTCLI